MDGNLLVLIGLVIVAFLISGGFYILRKEIFKLPISLIFVTALIVISMLILDLSIEDLGFSNIFNGILWGLGISIGVALVLYIGSRLSFTKSFFSDDRTKDLPRRKLFYRVFVDIPITTVLLEEIVFRGVIYGFLVQAYGITEAVIISSALFGLWHVLPSITYSQSNDKAPSKIPTILGTVAFTSVSGILFALLRLWSGSIIAPIALHYAVNTSSLILSWFSQKKK